MNLNGVFKGDSLKHSLNLFTSATESKLRNDVLGKTKL